MSKFLLVFALFFAQLGLAQEATVKSVMGSMGGELRIIATGVFRGTNLDGSELESIKVLETNAQNIIDAINIILDEDAPLFPTQFALVTDEVELEELKAEYTSSLEEVIDKTEELQEALANEDSDAASALIRELGGLQQQGHTAFKQ